MNPSVKITRKQATKIIAQSFPEYHGRKINIEFTPTVTFWDTNWSGGTKNTYVSLRADGSNVRLHAPAPWNNPIEGKTIDLPVDVLIICRSYFCGNDCGLTIFANPIHAPKWLPAEV